MLARSMRAIVALAPFLFLACDVSTPARFVPDAEPLSCGELVSKDAPVFVDLSCDRPECTAVVAQDGCHLRVQIGGCQDHDLRATIGSDGVPLFEPSDSAGTCVASETKSGSFLGFRCTSPTFACDFDLYTEVDRSADFDLGALVIDDRPYLPPNRIEHFLNYIFPLSGWLGGMTLLQDEVVIVKHGRYDDPTCPSKTSTTASFVFVDQRSLIFLGETPAPACAIDLARDPTGDGFIAGYGGNTPTVGIFDRQGMLIRSATIAAGPSNFLVDLETAGNVLYVLISSLDADSFVTTFDLPALTPRQTSLKFEHRARALMPVLPGGVAISDGARNGIRLLDGDLNDYGVVQLVSIRGNSNDPGTLVLDPESGLLMIASTGTLSAIWVLDPRTTEAVRGQGVAYERLAVPWAIAKLRGTRMLAGLTARTDRREAFLALFEIEGAHFLPGMVKLGRGVVRGLLPDTRGNYFALLPWEGRLVRIEPR